MDAATFIANIEDVTSTLVQFTSLDWNFEMVNLLLDAGADPGAAGKDGTTPLMCCAQVCQIFCHSLKVFLKILLFSSSSVRSRYLWFGHA